MVLKRFVKGLTQEPFFQKRVPDGHPDFHARDGVR